MRQFQLLVFGLALLVSIHLKAGGGQLIVDFTISDGPSEVGQVVTFTDASNPASCHGGIYGWSWDFGDGASPSLANTQGPHEVTYSTLVTKSIG